MWLTKWWKKKPPACIRFKGTVSDVAQLPDAELRALNRMFVDDVTTHGSRHYRLCLRCPTLCNAALHEYAKRWPLPKPNG